MSTLNDDILTRPIWLDDVLSPDHRCENLAMPEFYKFDCRAFYSEGMFQNLLYFVGCDSGLCKSNVFISQVCEVRFLIPFVTLLWWLFLSPSFAWIYDYKWTANWKYSRPISRVISFLWILVLPFFRYVMLRLPSNTTLYNQVRIKEPRRTSPTVYLMISYNPESQGADL